MEVFIVIISCILVTSTPLIDLMRYPPAEKLYYSELPLATCGLIAKKCNSEEVEAIQDTAVTENIYKHASDTVAHDMSIRGINMPLSSLCPLPPTHWELLPSLRHYSPVSIFKTSLLGVCGGWFVEVFVVIVLFFFFFFPPSGKKTSTGTSSDN